MLNKKLLVATIKAIANNNYEIANSDSNNGSVRSKALDEYLSMSLVLRMIEEVEALEEMAKIYGVEV